MHKVLRMTCIVTVLTLIVATSGGCAGDNPGEAGESASRLRTLMIDASSAGKKPFAVLRVAGRLTRVQVVGADAAGVTVSSPGAPGRIAWDEIPPKQFASLAAKFASTGRAHLLVAHYCAFHKLPEKAEKACRKALEMDDGLEDEVRSLLALLRPEAPRRPTQPVLIRSSGMGNITVKPKESDELLANPGMGWETFGRPANRDPNLKGLPSSTLYQRWYWKKLEPTDGDIQFSIIDDAIAKGRAAGQQLAFRAMTAGGGAKGGSPLWLKDAGCKGYTDSDTDGTGQQWIPDHDDPLFLEKQLRLIAELGKRYDGHPDVAHVDIGSVGFWGEWHFSGSKVPMPTLENCRRIVDAYFDAFKKTPLVALIGHVRMLEYATHKGAGWRADCLGDMGGFSKTWSHMENCYKQNVAKADANDAWKHGPVAWETCWDMRKWVNEKWDVRYIFDYALELHGSYVNNKSAPIPEGFRGEVERLLRKLGYRFVLRSLTHPKRARRGSKVKVMMDWENVGVAPCYADYVLAFRFTGPGSPPTVVRTDITVRTWLPGPIRMKVIVALRGRLASGTYLLSVGIVDAQNKPVVKLAIEGRDAEGWYPVSKITIE